MAGEEDEAVRTGAVAAPGTTHPASAASSAATTTREKPTPNRDPKARPAVGSERTLNGIFGSAERAASHRPEYRAVP